MKFYINTEQEMKDVEAVAKEMMNVTFAAKCLS